MRISLAVDLGLAARARAEAAGRLQCTFGGGTIERVSWDRAVTLNLTACRRVQLDFYCPDAAPD